MLSAELKQILRNLNKPIKKVNAFNGWDPLKQIILGNVMNPSFFDDVADPKLRHLLQKLLYETQEDLDNYQKELEKAGVDVVCIPAGTMQDGSYYTNMNDAMEKDMSWTNGGMPRPMITPRDQFITLGNQLVFTHVSLGTAAVINELMKDNTSFNYDSMSKFIFEKKVAIGNEPIHASNVDEIPMGPFVWRDPNTSKGVSKYNIWDKLIYSYCWDAPYVTRVGDKLVVDSEDRLNMGKWLLNKFPEYKHVSHTIGGHNDGTFCPLKPGHLITAAWHVDYSDTFPGWDVHVVRDDPEVKYSMYDRDLETFVHLRNQKKKIDRTWWTPDAKNNEKFTEFVDEWLHQWTGWSAESIFEVNALVINPELVFFSNYNKGVFDYCESIGITPHIVPFRHRHFWDGGLHCLTVDTLREGGMQSYFE